MSRAALTRTAYAATHGFVVGNSAFFAIDAVISLQTIALVLADSHGSPWRESGTSTTASRLGETISPLALVRVDETLGEATFLATLTMAQLGLATLAALTGATFWLLRNGTRQPGHVLLQALRTLTFAFSTVLFIPSVSVLARALACPTTEDGSKFVGTSSSCWAGIHLGLALLAACLFIVLAGVVAAGTLGFVSSRMRGSAVHARSTAREELVLQPARALLAVLVNTTSGSVRHGWAVGLLCVALGLLWAGIYLSRRPYYHQVMNDLGAAAACAFLWLSALALVAKEDSNADHSIPALCGAALSFALGASLSRARFEMLARRPLGSLRSLWDLRTWGLSRLQDALDADSSDGGHASMALTLGGAAADDCGGAGEAKAASASVSSQERRAKQLLAEAEAAFVAMTRQFAHDPLAWLVVAQFYREFHSTQFMEIAMLARAASRGSAPDVRYALFVRHMELHEESTITSGGGAGMDQNGLQPGLDLESGAQGRRKGGQVMAPSDRLLFEQSWREVHVLYRVAYKKQAALWGTLQESEPDLRHVLAAGTELHRALSRMRTLYGAMMALDADNAALLRSYAAFLTHLQNDPANAKEFAERADRLDEVQARRTTLTLHGFQLGRAREHARGAEDADAFAAVFTVSGDSGTDFGVIVDASSAACAVLGYSLQGLRGQPLSLIWPTALRQGMNRSLQEFAHTGRGLVGETQMVLCRAQAGHSLAALLHVRDAPPPKDRMSPRLAFTLQPVNVAHGMLLVGGESDGYPLLAACRQSVVAFKLEPEALESGDARALGVLPALAPHFVGRKRVSALTAAERVAVERVAAALLSDRGLGVSTAVISATDPTMAQDGPGAAPAYLLGSVETTADAGQAAPGAPGMAASEADRDVSDSSPYSELPRRNREAGASGGGGEGGRTRAAPRPHARIALQPPVGSTHSVATSLLSEGGSGEPVVDWSSGVRVVLPAPSTLPARAGVVTPLRGGGRSGKYACIQVQPVPQGMWPSADAGLATVSWMMVTSQQLRMYAALRYLLARQGRSASSNNLQFMSRASPNAAFGPGGSALSSSSGTALPRHAPLAFGSASGSGARSVRVADPGQALKDVVLWEADFEELCKTMTLLKRAAHIARHAAPGSAEGGSGVPGEWMMPRSAGADGSESSSQDESRDRAIIHAHAHRARARHGTGAAATSGRHRSTGQRAVASRGQDAPGDVENSSRGRSASAGDVEMAALLYGSKDSMGSLSRGADGLPRPGGALPLDQPREVQLPLGASLRRSMGADTSEGGADDDGAGEDESTPLVVSAALDAAAPVAGRDSASARAHARPLQGARPPPLRSDDHPVVMNAADTAWVHMGGATGAAGAGAGEVMSQTRSLADSRSTGSSTRDVVANRSLRTIIADRNGRKEAEVRRMLRAVVLVLLVLVGFVVGLAVAVEYRDNRSEELMRMVLRSGERLSALQFGSFEFLLSAVLARDPRALVWYGPYSKYYDLLKVHTALYRDLHAEATDLVLSHGVEARTFETVPSVVMYELDGDFKVKQDVTHVRDPIAAATVMLSYLQGAILKAESPVVMDTGVNGTGPLYEKVAFEANFVNVQQAHNATVHASFADLDSFFSDVGVTSVIAFSALIFILITACGIFFSIQVYRLHRKTLALYTTFLVLPGGVVKAARELANNQLEMLVAAEADATLGMQDDGVAALGVDVDDDHIHGAGVHKRARRQDAGGRAQGDGDSGAEGGEDAQVDWDGVIRRADEGDMKTSAAMSGGGATVPSSRARGAHRGGRGRMGARWQPGNRIKDSSKFIQRSVLLAVVPFLAIALWGGIVYSEITTSQRQVAESVKRMTMATMITNLFGSMMAAILDLYVYSPTPETRLESIARLESRIQQIEHFGHYIRYGGDVPALHPDYPNPMHGLPPLSESSAAFIPVSRDLCSAYATLSGDIGECRTIYDGLLDVGINDALQTHLSAVRSDMYSVNVSTVVPPGQSLLTPNTRPIVSRIVLTDEPYLRGALNFTANALYDEARQQLDDNTEMILLVNSLFVVLWAAFTVFVYWPALGRLGREVATMRSLILVLPERAVTGLPVLRSLIKKLIVEDVPAAEILKRSR